MNVGLGSCTYWREGGRRNKITIGEALEKEFWTTFLEDHSASVLYGQREFRRHGSKYDMGWVESP